MEKNFDFDKALEKWDEELVECYLDRCKRRRVAPSQKGCNCWCKKNESVFDFMNTRIDGRVHPF